MLALLLGVLCVGGWAAVSAETEGDFEYRVYTDSNSAYISDYLGSDAYVTIPSELGGYPVTSIGQFAFQNCTSLQSVTISQGIARIQNDAFSGCSSLQSVVIPSSVTNIWWGAFEDCCSLKSVTLPAGLESLGDAAFSGCTSLESITIPEGVGYVGDSAFFGCAKLQNVTLKEGVSTIGRYAFAGTAISSLSLPSGVAYIEEAAFVGCSNLKNISLPSGLNTIGNYAFERCAALTDMTIPADVKYVYYGAFTDCTALERVTFLGDVRVLAQSVFKGCSALSDIVMQGDVRWIGYDTFRETAYYRNEANWDNGVLYIGNHLIEAKDTLSGAYTVREGTTAIASSAFSGCEALTDITLPDSVTSVGEYAFDNTGYYNNEANWDDGVLYLGEHLIAANDEVKDLFVIRDGTKTVAPKVSIATGAVVIPKSLTLIGYGAFSGMRATIYYGGNEQEWDELVIEYTVILWYKNADTGVADSNAGFFWQNAMTYNFATYAVSYHANGGEGAPMMQTKIPGTPLTLRTAVPTREGYAFLGWATSASATAATYQPGDAFKNNTDTTLYAVWEAQAEEPILGDLNGDEELDMRDAFALYSAVSGGAELTEEQMAAADMNGDGEYDMRDAFVLYQMVSGG